jgi:hypothetical protein
LFLKVITPVVIHFSNQIIHGDSEKETYENEKNIYDPTNFDNVLSSAISLLSKTIDICGFYGKVADFLEHISHHLLGNRIIDEENLKVFYPNGVITDDQILSAYLVIFNCCAPKFSGNKSVQ